tara:strand:+ start:222 stop:638 length:417 start_codon:yes stop_codon:yes gene_type:complete
MNKLKTVLIILNFVIVFILYIDLPVLAINESAELPKCIVITHCVRKNWETEDVKEGFEEALQIIKQTPRTKLIERNDDYVHFEATTKWMHYVDDLEIKAFPEKNLIQVRSESRVGIGDNGVNKKRVDKIRSQMKSIIQ